MPRKKTTTTTNVKTVHLDYKMKKSLLVMRDRDGSVCEWVGDEGMPS